MYYREDKAGQILQEGINEAGGMSSWIAAATSYSTNNRIMVPFYVYYSMFGFQRIGDLAWAAGDMQARGFLLGGTSGRTTLNGEGLQHEDGHSHILAGTIPNCISYDPTFAHEVGVILHHGLKRMVEKQDNVYYYLTLLNENYPMPGLKAGTEEQIIKGMYLLEEGAEEDAARQPAGQRHHPARVAWRRKELLEKDWGVAANVWSCPSFNELARDGQDAERWNLLHPTDKPRVPFVTQQLEQARRPGGRVDRLHEELRRADPRLHPQGPHLQGAGHRRLRPQRLPQQAARALRGQPPLHRGRRAEGAGRRGHACRWPRWPRRSRSTASTPTRSTRCTHKNERRRHDMALVEVKVPDIGDFKEVEVIELLVKPGDTVKAEQSLITVESRQGVDGDPVVARRRGQGAEGQARRQGQRRHAGAGAGGRGRCGSCARAPRRCRAAPAAAPAAAAPAAAAPRPRPPAPARSRCVVPDIGDFNEVAVIEVLVKPGDTIKVEQSLITVESDKASMEIPSSHAGVVKEAEGQARRQGRQGHAGGGASMAAAALRAAPRRRARRCSRRGAARPRRASAPAAACVRRGRCRRTSPTARQGRAAARLAVDPQARARTRRAAGRSQGQRPQGPHHAGRRAGLRQGRDGRRACRPQAQKAKAPAAAAGGGAFPGLLPWPQVDFAKFGPIERKDLSRIKKISGANLHRNWVMIPHVTNHDDADITELEAFRVQLNKENEKTRRQGHDARLPDQGLRSRR